MFFVARVTGQGLVAAKFVTWAGVRRNSMVYVDPTVWNWLFLVSLGYNALPISEVRRKRSPSIAVVLLTKMELWSPADLQLTFGSHILGL